MKKLTIAALAIAGLALLAACASLGGAEALLGGGEEDAAPALVADLEQRWTNAYQALGDRVEELALEAAERAAERAAEITRLQGEVDALNERVERQQTIAAELYTEAEAAKEQLRQAREFLDGTAFNDTPAVEAAQQETP